MEYNVKKEFIEEKEEILQSSTVEETCTVFIKEDVKNEFLGKDKALKFITTIKVDHSHYST